jgi:hypothetical protein
VPPERGDDDERHDEHAGDEAREQDGAAGDEAALARARWGRGCRAASAAGRRRVGPRVGVRVRVEAVGQVMREPAAE